MREHSWPASQSLGLSNPGTVDYDDNQLVISSKNNDQDAFSLLVQRHQRRVFNLVFRMLQNYEEANEVTQEAFLVAWQGLPAFRGEVRFSTWLYRIAYTCAVKQLETRKRDKAPHKALQAGQTLEGEALKNALLETLDHQEIVQEQLSQLPPKYQIVLILRHVQDMTYEEMAEVLSMPVGTLKTHVFRARNLLKERLQAFESGRKQKGTRDEFMR